MREAEAGTAQLRVLAHPTRLALLRRLRTMGPGTARALGRELGLDSGAASYHLRRLAEGGLIVEEPGLGTRRERWWRAVADSVQFDPAEHEDDLTREYVRATLAALADDLRGVAAAVPSVPREWLERAAFLDDRLWIDDGTADALRGELLAVLERYRPRSLAPDVEGQAEGRPAPTIVQVQLYRRP
ncbi:transcriptional regulator, ArsR family [Krasilnikoviella flava]|uniref:Transcriptional regulator, ArsR family n=2 Tax=Krasilnikoviella flava TaxID=526729 RepID=A0A1T5JJ15_9MICO|nr:transcriptional regulator, ArsR family [Krasilnikoviella flava]